MEPHDLPFPAPRPPEAHEPRCPVCGGLVFELRGMLRCTLCYLTICDGCCGTEALVSDQD
jgi:hypothetical protein